MVDKGCATSSGSTVDCVAEDAGEGYVFALISTGLVLTGRARNSLEILDNLTAPGYHYSRVICRERPDLSESTISGEAKTKAT